MNALIVYLYTLIIYFKGRNFCEEIFVIHYFLLNFAKLIFVFQENLARFRRIIFFLPPRNLKFGMEVPLDMYRVVHSTTK